MSEGSSGQVVLGIDTSVAVAVGVAVDGQVRANRWLGESRQHVEQVSPMVSGVLADDGLTAAELTGIVVGMGPGPFTGLRVGVATALALAEALAIDLHGVCGLDVVAAAVSDPPEEFLVLADARRGELYWAHYGVGRTRIGEPRVGKADTLPRLPVTGPGIALAGDHEALPAGPDRVDAGLLAQIGRSLPSVGPEPLYLRQADAVAPTSRKSTLVNRAGRVRLRGQP